MEPIERFYPFRPSSKDAEHLSFAILEAMNGPEAMLSHDSEHRAVVFEPLMGEGDSYASAGAVALMRKASLPVTVNASSIPLVELPDGLAMLCGDAIDVTAYSSRNR